MKKLSRLAPVFVLLACAAARAEPAVYRLDPLHTRVWWEVRHFGTSTQRGRFDAVPQASIRIDREAGVGHVSLSIETGSVSSGTAALDTMLRGANFLASASNPTAYFVASRVQFDHGKVVALRGELTLRGVPRPFGLQATRFDCRSDPLLRREVCGGDFEGELLRSDYGSTFGLPFVGDKVRLLISVEAVRDASP
jgi:polyisoprenoid-binding protein YceI